MKQHSWVFDYIREARSFRTNVSIEAGITLHPIPLQAVQNTQKQSAVPPEAWQAQVTWQRFLFTVAQKDRLIDPCSCHAEVCM